MNDVGRVLHAMFAARAASATAAWCSAGSRLTTSSLPGTVRSIMERAPADVAVVIEPGLSWPPRSVLVPSAGGTHDRAALAPAGSLVGRTAAALMVLVVHRLAMPVPAVDPVRVAGAVRLVESASPLDAVIEEAAAHDLTVLGVGEDWQPEAHVFGLRSERLVADCPSSLLVVRGRVDAGPGRG